MKEWKKNRIMNRNGEIVATGGGYLQSENNTDLFWVLFQWLDCVFVFFCRHSYTNTNKHRHQNDIFIILH